MVEKVRFIINAFSGKGFKPSMGARIIAACEERNLDFGIEYTRQKGHATDLAREAVAQGVQKVFACGGDGTVNEVAQGLVHTPVAMGILPLGSGNGLARHLQIPIHLHDALHLLQQHTIISMDTLVMNNHLAVNVAGIGFDAHVATQFGQNGKRGLSGYARLVLKEFSGFKEFETKVVLDGTSSEHRSFVVAIANSSQFGNNARISPKASVTDGLMDVCFIRKVPLIEAVGFTTKLFTGRIDKSRFAKIINAKEFQAVVSSPMPYHIDGEPFAPTNTFDIRVDRESLRVMVPS